MNLDQTGKIFLLFIFLGVTYLVISMAWSFKDAIIFSVILSSLFYSFNERLMKRFRFSRNVSSFIVCVVIILLIFLPLLFIISRLSVETYGIYTSQKSIFTFESLSALLEGLSPYLNSLNQFLILFDVQIDFNDITKYLIDNVNALSAALLGTAQSWITGTFSVTLSFLFQFIIMMMAIYALLVSGKAIKNFVFALIPLTHEQEDKLLKKLNQMNYITFVCNGLGGLIQGVLAGIAFYIVDIEPVFLWGAIMVILAFIPLVGISLVYIPACFYLFIIGSYYSGIFLFIYCTAIALIVENWYKPKFIGKHVKINSLLLLLSIIGGLIYFGAMGIFYGPLILTCYLSIYDFLTDNGLFTGKEVDTEIFEEKV